ncbi:hypothetical protein O9Z70_13630 [Devosia sp. YIM 151766]|uniref:hypothetical protein n=1 Tax=Devosia sp. YIM 151766 TaxID=3017325 RepID=UPI00255C67E7|nr:hypothetical protein [Devosia sp. YIM 151766]WIY52488.1 hypothetical protein O9Z70_13630 [Devosia sp. YIM 151766]
MTKSLAPFEADCSRCFGLCCVALSFERGSQFGHDKAAGQPCHHLAEDFRCRIHERREALGYEGCEAFDCLGAGQRASAMFAGENWRRDASVARRLYASFSLLMRLQEMRQALETAADLEIGAVLQDERRALLARLAEQAESGREDVAETASATLAEAKAFLKRLAPTLAG